jgi:hypothetical protein
MEGATTALNKRPRYKPVERNLLMKRSLILIAMPVVFVLAVAFSAPYPTTTVKAQPPDPCVKCLEKLEREFEKCEAKYGVGQMCYDLFNNGIIECYATVCEQ